MAPSARAAKPADHWPEPVLRSFSHLNRKIYVPMQGPSDMGASGKLERWDRMAGLIRFLKDVDAGRA
ncbi:hypothetical protein [Ideonella sp. B508-1]|uniref:hypothetical protein n=1 Tax=Ideonella sp. B508-1 TaxID=137716 RepID=UPI00058CCF7C|nr:hypothetical protein [Ideonella sp. B508-1]